MLRDSDFRPFYARVMSATVVDDKARVVKSGVATEQVDFRCLTSLSRTLDVRYFIYENGKETEDRKVWDLMLQLCQEYITWLCGRRSCRRWP